MSTAVAGAVGIGDEGPPAEAQGNGGSAHRPRVAALVALAAVVVLGLYLRIQNLTTGGLERDDAWVALTAHVRLPTALRMGATAPGFTMVERTWVLLNPGSAKWAQLLPLAASVTAIVAVYALVRYVGLARGWAIAGAFVMAVSPIALTESTHVKQYGIDILLCCGMLALYEGARRSASTRALGLAALGSFVALGASASIIPILIGVWLALLLTSLRDKTRLLRVVVAGAVAGALCLPLVWLFSRHVSTALHRYWLLNYGFIWTKHWSGFVNTTWLASHRLASDLIGMHGTALTFATWALIALLVLGATRGGPGLACSLAILTAVAASIAGRIPLGTGRTDEVLFPALILLALLGAQRATALVIGLSTRLGVAGPGAAVLIVAAALVVAAVGLPLVVDPIQRSTGYPGVDLPPLVHQIDAHRQPGDLIYVEALSRYPWALAYPDQARIVVGPGWGAGFTTVSTGSGVFIVPSEWWESGYDPQAWSATAAKASRLWFIGTGPPGYHQHSHDFQTLVAHGWHPQQSLTGHGAYAVLMTR